MKTPNQQSDEMRQLATAIKTLAESNQGIGGIVRELVASQGETNRVLGLIHDQNAAVLAHMESFAQRHSQSERRIRVVESVLTSNVERLERIEAALKLQDTDQLPRS